MAKAAPDAFMDAAFDWVDQSDKMVVCSAQPTTYAEANATFALADVAMTPDTDARRKPSISNLPVRSFFL